MICHEVPDTISHPFSGKGRAVRAEMFVPSLQFFCLGQASDSRERYIGAAEDRSGLWLSLAHVEEAHEIHLVWKRPVLWC